MTPARPVYPAPADADRRAAPARGVLIGALAGACLWLSGALTVLELVR